MRECRARSTTRHGDRSLHSQGSGQESCWTLSLRRWWTQSRRGLAANDALDNAALRFLVARALLDRREQEEERSKREEEVKKRMKVWLDQRTAEGRRELEQSLDSGGASSKRKKKKRRKRLPKASSSLLRRGARSSVSGCCLKSTRFGSWEMTSGSSPYSVFSWLGSGHSTCVSRRCFWFLFHIFLCEGGTRLLRSILAATCPHGFLQAQDARHLGRYGPEGHLCRDTETASVARAGRTWKVVHDPVVQVEQVS